MLLRQFWRSRRGNFSLMLAVGVPAMLGAVAFATDVSTLMRAKSNLQTALDAANLASSHLGDAEVTRNDAFNSYFQANVASHGELSNAKATLTVDRGVNFVKTRATASADVNLNFAFLFGAEKHISVDASAVESNNQLEVVLVLDNTGSMAGARITALRTASKSLLDYLEAVKSPTRSVRASLVPFVTAVNVNGPEFDPSWIDMDGKSSTNGVNFPVIDGKRPNHMALFRQLGQKGGWSNTGWKGCVEARPGALNVSDTPPDPSKPDTLFVPYFAPDDPDVAKKPSASYGNSSTGYNNSYLNDTIDKTKLNQNILGIDLSGLLTGVLNALLSADLTTIAKYVASTGKEITEAGNPITIGPNRACPTPIVPLTDDFDKLRQAASQMSEWNGSGTNVSEGLSWGQRVLSPQPPYTDAAPYRTAGKGGDAFDRWRERRLRRIKHAAEIGLHFLWLPRQRPFRFEQPGGGGAQRRRLDKGCLHAAEEPGRADLHHGAAGRHGGQPLALQRLRVRPERLLRRRGPGQAAQRLPDHRQQVLQAAAHQLTRGAAAWERSWRSGPARYFQFKASFASTIGHGDAARSAQLVCATSLSTVSGKKSGAECRLPNIMSYWMSRKSLIFGSICFCLAQSGVASPAGDRSRLRSTTR